MKHSGQPCLSHCVLVLAVLELMTGKSAAGLLLGTEAAVMTPSATGVDLLKFAHRSCRHSLRYYSSCASAVQHAFANLPSQLEICPMAWATFITE